MNLNIKSSVVSSALQTAASGLLLLVLYRKLTLELGIAILGLWSVLSAIVAAARISELGISSCLSPLVASALYESDKQKAASDIQTAFYFVLLSTTAVAVMVWIFHLLILSHFVPADFLGSAVEVIPVLLLTLVFANVSAVFQSALDGCHRVTLRNKIQFVGNSLFSLTAYFSVSSFGIEALAYAQLAQVVFTAVTFWFSIRVVVDTLPMLPRKYSHVGALAILKTATKFQLNTLAALLFEPTAKLLLGKFGGLTAAGLYEIATQIISKLRSIIISANQALIPAFGALARTDKMKSAMIRNRAEGIVRLIVPVSFGAICAMLPMFSVVLTGHRQDELYYIGTILCVGWMANTLSAPAYFHNQGSLNIGPNTVSHLLQSGFNVVVGSISGGIFGTFGVVCSISASLVLGSIYLMRRSPVILSDMLSVNPPSRLIWLFVIAVTTGLAVSNGIYFLAPPNIAGMMFGTVPAIGYMCVIGAASIILRARLGAYYSASRS